MNIGNKIVFTLMLLMCIVITGCSTDKSEVKENIKEENKEEVKEKQKMLLCKNSPNMVVFNFDENKNVVSIYYEKVFDMNDYYTVSELAEFKIYKHTLPKIISERIIDCNNTTYSCISNYDNYIITNKVYVENYKDAQLFDLDEFYGTSYETIRQIFGYKGITCEEIDKDNKYIINENNVKININGIIYSSIEEMNYGVNKPEYHKKYTLTEFDGKKAIIEFKEDGKCEINLKEFEYDVWSSKSYCDKEKHRKMNKLTYLNGNCNYTVNNEYYFNIVYDGKYEYGQYCENYDDKLGTQTKDVVSFPNHMIKIEFDDTYNSFTFLNGSWRNNKITGIVEYK